MTTLAAVVALAGSTGQAMAAEDRGNDFTALVRYTENGVAHIKANTFGGVGYGYGYAAATDNVCVIADMYVTLAAQRSRFFGPDAPGNVALSDAATSLSSDLYFQQVNDSGLIEKGMRQPAPLGPKPEVRELVRGYVAGYNRFVAEGRVTDPACRGAAWVRPISEIDVYRHLHALLVLAGEGQLMDGITSAQPPAAAAQSPAAVPAGLGDRVRAAMESKKDMGSNAFALGRDASANGRGLLVGNPHYPWQGGRRFWQAQLTVPGRMDVSGASLLGLPLVQIGYNRDVAWSHTVSTPVGFSLYQLKLTSPTTYLVDGKPEAMTNRTVRVQVRGADGKLSTVERTLWSTRYGPVLGGGFGLPVAWTRDTAYALKDANVDNFRGLNMWFDFDLARSTGDIVRSLSTNLASPWVNTIAADRSGNATYADIQVVPNITDELAKKCNTPLGNAIFQDTGLAVLDGSTTGCAWGNDKDAVQPGLFGPSRQPLLTRGDYVENANDSAWLANPHQPITGYPRIIGDIGTARSPRTRMAITELDGRKFSRQSIQDMLFSDRSLMGQLTVTDVVAMCRTLPDVGNACDSLAKWDRTFTSASRGAALFGRFWKQVPPDAWKVPFNPADPVGTPNTLDTARPEVRKAFTDAVAVLRAANIPFDAPLSDSQYVTRNGEKISVHGAPGNLGVLNVLTPVRDNGQGSPDIIHGSSYIQAVSFTDSPCPDARTLLTYSQSTDPTSPHFADQTKLFSRGKWVRGRFCEWDIWTSPQLKVLFLKG
ncbi:penicillin acylase family protein [Actinocrispum wychmicini]|nr:penicillin acylase family protein [Actinocrispum wychmicini]